MLPTDARVSAHYDVGDLEERILVALQRLGISSSNILVDDLAVVDEFHLRGRIATDELLRWVNPQEIDLIIDIGSGLGGTSRHLANIAGCRVIGIDLSTEFCEVANSLSSRVGLSHLTEFIQGNALSLPFPGEHFDVAWTEHVQMNIADKEGFYSEISRILKLGGKFAFHDVFAGNGEPLLFPVPWASEPSISYLAGFDDAQSVLRELGFAVLVWEEKTQASIEFLKAAKKRIRQEGRGPLGLHLLMGEDAGQKLSNLLENLESGKVRVLAAVLEKK